MNRAVMIVAGGTGGHVYPGLAVAAALAEAGIDLSWLGTARGLESRVVPAAGYTFTTIPVSGLRGHGILRWLLAPITLTVALACAIAAILRSKPRVVLGMGGFVSGPGGLAAWLCRRPLIIHEQNAIPGLTNRILSRLASRVLQAFPETFPAARAAIVTGNPVRGDIAALPPPAQRLREREGDAALNVLVFGGSRGARALNETLPRALAASHVRHLNIVHQCGTDDVASTRARYDEHLSDAAVEVVPFIEDMAAAYALADVVVARAGALTIAEIAACGVAAVLVPYPFAVDDHQTVNANVLVAAGAALLVPERELDAGRLGDLLRELLSDRERLRAMAERAREHAAGDATAAVTRHCLDLIDA